MLLLPPRRGVTEKTGLPYEQSSTTPAAALRASVQSGAALFRFLPRGSRAPSFRPFSLSSPTADPARVKTTENTPATHGRSFSARKGAAKNAKPVARGARRRQRQKKQAENRPNKRMRSERGTEGGRRCSCMSGRKREFECARKTTRCGGWVCAPQRRQRNARVHANAWTPANVCVRFRRPFLRCCRQNTLIIMSGNAAAHKLRCRVQITRESLGSIMVARQFDTFLALFCFVI